MSSRLEIRELTVGYGGAIAIEGISFDLRSGEFITFIGPNGAGKTTLLNALMGVLSPLSGTILFEGVDIGALRPEQRVATGLVIVPERRELFAELTVEDNLRLGAYRRRRSPDVRSGAALGRVYDIFPKLAERRRQVVGTLSGGEQQLVAVGRALMADPCILMLDEPSTGLAPLIMEEIFHAIEQLKRAGMTGILVEQNARAALAVSDRAFVLETGAVVLSGAAADLSADPRVTAAYLGAAASYA